MGFWSAESLKRHSRMPHCVEPFNVASKHVSRIKWHVMDVNMTETGSTHLSDARLASYNVHMPGFPNPRPRGQALLLWEYLVATTTHLYSWTFSANHMLSVCFRAKLLS